MITAFGPVEIESDQWVELSRAGLERLNQPNNPARAWIVSTALTMKAIEHAKTLAADGKRDEANATSSTLLLTLTDRDPAMRKTIEDARGGSRKEGETNLCPLSYPTL